MEPPTDPTTTTPTTAEEEQAARLKKFTEHRKKVNVYRITEDDTNELVQGDAIKQKGIRKGKQTPSDLTIKTKRPTAKNLNAPLPTISKKYGKKATLPQPVEPIPAETTVVAIDTDKLLLGCVCIGLGLYLIYLTRQGSLEAREIVSDT